MMKNSNIIWFMGLAFGLSACSLKVAPAPMTGEMRVVDLNSKIIKDKPVEKNQSNDEF